MRCAVVLLVLVVAAIAAPSAKKRPFGSIDFDRYWSLDEIYEFMAQLEADYPDITEVEQMGRTQEGREIRGLRITSEEHLGRETLPIIFVTAGTSARDWITVMAAVDIMHELVEHYEDFRSIVDDIEWFVIPVANPDGYEFSRLQGVKNKLNTIKSKT
jgi:murein tripeptide amidase MpaA